MSDVLVHEVRRQRLTQLGFDAFCSCGLGTSFGDDLDIHMGMVRAVFRASRRHLDPRTGLVSGTVIFRDEIDGWYFDSGRYRAVCQTCDWTSRALRSWVAAGQGESHRCVVGGPARLGKLLPFRKQVTSAQRFR